MPRCACHMACSAYRVLFYCRLPYHTVELHFLLEPSTNFHFEFVRRWCIVCSQLLNIYPIFCFFFFVFGFNGVPVQEREEREEYRFAHAASPAARESACVRKRTPLQDMRLMNNFFFFHFSFDFAWTHCCVG